MAEISTNSGKITVSAGQNTVNVGVTKDYSQYYSQLSKDWATKTNGLVNNEDYSSKYYAEKSKDWATNSENNLISVISEHEQITSEITQAREDISTERAGALLDIETSKKASLTAIDNAKTSGITSVNTARDNGVETVNSALKDFNTTVTTAKSDINKLKDSSMSAVETAQTTAETSIKSLQSLAETSVNNGIANIETSKNNAISDISTAGAKQVANIQQTGFFMQDNKLYYITSEGETKELKSGSGYNLFDLKYSDHILEGNEAKGFALLGSYAYKTGVAGSRYGYPDFYNKCVAEKIAGTETTITVGDYSFTGYKNANGHIYFDIADKNTVDNIYTSTGKAWYYGIDTANERIFLPRVKNALVGMTDIANTSAVVPNTTNPMPQFTVHNDLDAVGNLHTFSVRGEPFNQGHWDGRHGNNNGNLLWTTNGNTGLLSDNANVKSALNNDNFYIYMCVGNTEQESAVTDVIDITTSENDTLPLGWSDYQRGVTPSSAFLASLGQQNSGTLYPSFYNEFSAKIGQAFGAGFVKAHTASDITDYDLVINQDEQTFRLPLKNGEENQVGDEYIQINTLPANDTTLTAPANGYYTISVFASATTSRFYMTNLSNNLTVGEEGATLSSVSWNYVMPCKKGDKIRFHYESITILNDIFYFCPNIGNGTLYYKVSNAVQNLQLLDVAEMTTALAKKVDSTNTQWAVNACMPDYSAGKNVSSATIHTATVDGYVFAQAQSTSGGNGGHVDIYDKNGTLIKSWHYVGAEMTQTYSYSAFMCPIPKGYSYNVHGGVNIVIQFYPAKGTEV